MQDKDLIVHIDESWSNDYSLGLRGWIISKYEHLDRVEVCVNGISTPITSWHNRPDVVKKYPTYRHKNKCGFVLNIPRITKHDIILKIDSKTNSLTKQVTIEGSRPRFPKGVERADTLFSNFTKLVNEKNLEVLEIGSRVVSPGSDSNRKYFSPGLYTGFDYYPDDNTDVVGDAHRLSQYFDNKNFGAIFSQSVFEHLAMPWVVAMEMNKLLKIGGITYHATHFAWPLHEKPWDFWRYSDEGLKVLFSKAMGFKVIKAGFFSPLSLHLDSVSQVQATLATQPAFGGVAILAEKVSEINTNKFRWDITLEEFLEPDSHYPEPTR